MQKLTSILIVFLFYLVCDLNAGDKNKIFNDLIDKIENAQRFKIIYSSEYSSEKNASIYIEKGNKYRIDLGNRMIACDSVTVWNYDIEKKKVTITNYENFDGQISIPNLFLNLKKNYKPISLKKKHSSKNEAGIFILLLKSEKDQSEIELALDKNYKVKRMSFQSDGFTQSWKIISLHFNPLQVQSIKLESIDDFEIIDLR